MEDGFFDWSSIGIPELIIIAMLLILAFCGRRMHRPMKCPPPVCGPFGELPKHVKTLRRSSDRSDKPRLVA